MYIPWPCVIMFPFELMNASLSPVTRYVNGMHFIALVIVWCIAIWLRFHTTGVNQKNSCIIIPSKFVKSGTSVDSADVNLVTASKNAYAEIIIYSTCNTFGTNPYAIHVIVAIINKNRATNELAISEIIGMMSTGNTTFFTK